MRLRRWIGLAGAIGTLLVLACDGGYPAGLLHGGEGGGAGGHGGTGGRGGSGGHGGTGGPGGSGPGGSGGGGGAGCASDVDCDPGFTCEIQCTCSDPSCCHGVCVPRLPPCPARSRDVCETDGACRWLVPGCGEPALPREGCFPAGDCRNAECPPDRTCQGVVVDPCAGKRCDACAQQVFLCLPPRADCSGAVVGADGRCRGPDGTARPPACCTWDCDPAHAACDRQPPRCAPGELPAVVGACWGPCVPGERCQATTAEQRCAATGGKWETNGCGSSTCGIVPSGCVAAEPGCICGPTEIFDPERGCLPSDMCLCQQTQGAWDPYACGHYHCGLANGCEAIIPGCDCGATRVFVPGRGCMTSTECFSGEGEPCGDRTGKTCLRGLVCKLTDPGVPGVCLRG